MVNIFIALNHKMTIICHQIFRKHAKLTRFTRLLLLFAHFMLIRVQIRVECSSVNGVWQVEGRVFFSCLDNILTFTVTDT